MPIFFNRNHKKHKSGGPKKLDNVLISESIRKRKDLTMGKKRKKYSSELKAKVALPALKNEETTAEMAQRFGVHPTMISAWTFAA